MTVTRDSNHTLNQQRQRLEALVQPTRRPAGLDLTQALKQLGDRTMRFFTGQTEPRIWQRTRQGQPVWFAHDPITNRTRQFLTEQDVRFWLEKRYYE